MTKKDFQLRKKTCTYFPTSIKSEFDTLIDKMIFVCLFTQNTCILHSVYIHWNRFKPIFIYSSFCPCESCFLTQCKTPQGDVLCWVQLDQWKNQQSSKQDKEDQNEPLFFSHSQSKFCAWWPILWWQRGFFRKNPLGCKKRNSIP